MDPSPNRLLDIVFNKTSKAGKRFLNIGTDYLYRQYHDELLNPPPTDQGECDKLVATWLARLENVEFGLPHYPSIKPGSKKLAVGGIISAEGSPSLGPSGTSSRGDATPPPRRNQRLSDDCKARDQHACVVTGCKSSDGFKVEAAHILPFALANEARCRQYRFWSMLELFFGFEQTNHVFDVTVANLETLWNVVSLHNSIHSLYDSGHLVLVPMTMAGHLIPINSTHNGPYKLEIRFPKSLSEPELIQSNKILGKHGINPLYDRSKVTVFNNPNGPSIPCPSFFAFRAWLTWLKWEVLERSDWHTDIGHGLWA